MELGSQFLSRILQRIRHARYLYIKNFEPQEDEKEEEKKERMKKWTRKKRMRKRKKISICAILKMVSSHEQKMKKWKTGDNPPPKRFTLEQPLNWSNFFYLINELFIKSCFFSDTSCRFLT